MRVSFTVLEIIRPNGAMLRNIFYVVSGPLLACASYVDAKKHQAYYEWYTESVEVTNLFVFDFKEKVIHAAIM